MRVIREGKGWFIEEKCTGKGNGGGGCGALLEVEKNDIYLTYSYDYLGDKSTFYTFKCPCCGTENDIDAEYIPSGIKKLIKK